MTNEAFPQITHHQAHLSQSTPEIRISYQEAHPPSHTLSETILLIHGYDFRQRKAVSEAFLRSASAGTVFTDAVLDFYDN
jgi:hypothetical protein